MKKNLLFKAGIKTLSIVVLAFSILFSFQQSKAQTISNNQTGTQDGWYWSFWKDNGNASMTLYPGGRYTTTWNGVNNFTAGKGWAVGSPTREICFSGSFNGGSNGFLAVYGWTKNALIEYYVVENYGQWTPPGGTSKGTFTSDGGTYNIYQTTRTNQPSIIGTATFQQYWSVRTSKRSSGTVTFANHVAAWKAKGMNMGTTWDYQIIESEGYQSTGSSDITISSCATTACTTAAPGVSTPVTYTQNSNAIALTATGTSLKWYGTSATGGTASSTAPTPSTATVGSTTYYVSQTLNNCEGPRASIVVTVSAATGNCTTVAPTVNSPVSYTQSGTATALTATGTALKWYGTSATGGTSSSTAPTPSTSTVGSTTYYVSQTLNNCEGPRAAIVVNVTSSGSTGNNCTEAGSGAFHTGVYRNMFKELLNKTDAEVKTKVDAAFQQIFYGNTTQQLYYPVGTDMAYILDVANNDVRTEGMSYGMMICVQLDKQAEFDKIWKWAKTKMQRSDGFFNWQLNTNGTVKGSGPASDGEAYFITSLLFASNRWGNGTGINNYAAEAQDILKRVMAMGGNSNLFNASSKLITFVPSGDSYNYTDPSYNLPGFFECWKRWSTTNSSFWAQTPDAARKLLRDASNSTSGLYADYSNFDGTPKTTSFNSDSHRFMYDAWRSIMNLGMDYHWFKTDALQPAVAERYLTFFKNQGANYKNHYDWNGSNAGGDHSTGLVACNAVASFATTNTSLSTPFVQELWNVGVPTGTYRYYDGMLYMLGLLNCSGNFKAWKPSCTVTEIAEELQTNETFKVYPNPFSSNISVDVNGEFEYSVLSSSGEQLISGAGQNKIELGNELAQGIYFLKIKQSGSSKVVKICKN